MTTIRVGLVNVPVKVGAAAWLACWTILSARCSVLVVNESLSRRQRRVYRAAALARGWGQYGLRSSPNPIFFSRLRWAFLAGRVVPLHEEGPWAKRWPGYNAARFVTVLALLHRRSGERHVILGTHLVSNGDKNPVAWRAEKREESLALLRILVQGYLADGCVVWLLGDMNLQEPFDLGPGFRWVRGQGIDKIGLGLPPGLKVDGAAWRLVAAPTDHKHGVTARVRLITKEKP